MKRLITLAVFLMATVGIAAPAEALQRIAGDWVCVAVPATGIGACVGNPFP